MSLLALSAAHADVAYINTAVSADISIGNWTSTTPHTTTGTVTMMQADGATPAAGDSVTYAIDKVTSDPEGQNQIDASGASVTGDATPDANGVANVSVQWQPSTPNPCIHYVLDYIWLRIVDTSQPSLTTPQPVGTSPVASQAAPRASAHSAQATSVAPADAHYTFLPERIPIDCDPNGGGGDPGGGGPPSPPHPASVLKRSLLTHEVFSQTGNYGHKDRYILQVLDQFGNPWTNAVSIKEHFTDTVFTPDNTTADALRAKGYPGREATWSVSGSYFVDTNQGYLKFDTGAGTFWYKFQQNWTGSTSGGPYKKLNAHFIKHFQDHTERTP